MASKNRTAAKKRKREKARQKRVSGKVPVSPRKPPNLAEARSGVLEAHRRKLLTQENIAREAFLLWEEEGRPDGNQIVSANGEQMPLHRLQWLQAIDRLERLAEEQTESITE